MTNSAWKTRWITAPLVLLGLALGGCGGEDDAAESSGSTASEADDSAPETGEPTSPEADEPDPAAVAEAITNCDQLLLTTQQVGDALGIKVLAPKKDKAAGVVFGCEYASPDKAADGGQLSVDASTADFPPSDFSTATTPVEGVGDRAEFNPQPGATTILRVWSGDFILDLSVGGILLYEQFGSQEAMQAPLVELAQLALSALAG